MNNSKNFNEQEREWRKIYGRLASLMTQFGNEDGFGKGDYWIVDDNWGCRQHKLYINNLHLLAPPVIEAVQSVLHGFPHWEIVVDVDIPDGGKAWPAMGLIIRAREIVDDLQRAYFPKEIQDFKYAGSRPGRF